LKFYLKELIFSSWWIRLPPDF